MRTDCRLNLKTNPQTTNSSRANITEEENSYKYAEVLSLVQWGSMKNIWTLDSGASFYMTLCGYWFHTCQSYDGTVYMGDNSSCEIIRDGEV